MKKRVIVTIHGIRWKAAGDWQLGLGEFINVQNPEIVVQDFRYGHVMGVVAWTMTINGLLWLTKGLRKKYVGEFAAFLRRTAAEFPGHEISIAGHSFGTWITYEALREHPDIRVANVVLIAGVIPHRIQQTEIRNMLERGQIQSIHATSSTGDEVVGKIAVPPFGKLGYFGFRSGRENGWRIEAKPFESLELYNYLYDVQPAPDHGELLKNLQTYALFHYQRLTWI